LTATLQIVSFAEPDMIHGYESGNKSALTERRSEAAQEKISCACDTLARASGAGSGNWRFIR
jgi:hypothetical protein